LKARATILFGRVNLVEIVQGLRSGGGIKPIQEKVFGEESRCRCEQVEEGKEKGYPCEVALKISA
jgi:hypothetical protein